MGDKLPKYFQVGQRIQQIRQKYGLSQKKFADQIGLSNQMLSVLEKGSSKPTIPVLLAIEYVYKCRMEWLLTGDEPIFVTDFEPPAIPLIGKINSQKQALPWINKLISIFDEGDKNKIEAIKAQLKALQPAKEEEAENKAHKKGA